MLAAIQPPSALATKTVVSMRGILNLHKPVGVSSRYVVNGVQRLARKLKIGHAGTLDPLAEGVLVCCVGAATRLIESIQAQQKEYVAEFLLGQASPSDDVETEVTAIADAPIPTAGEIESVLRDWTGEVLQTPPAYSAVKVAGERAYRLARAGADVAIQPRPVRIDALELLDFAYPRVTLRIACGGGVYVRAIGRDVASQLGTAAVMTALTRTRIGVFRLDQAVAPETLNRENLAAALLPLTRAVAHLPQAPLPPESLEELRHGRFIDCPPELGAAASPEVAGLDATGDLAAILTRRGDGRLAPKRVFLEVAR